MKFRVGLVMGFAAGVYVGSWAGRERYRTLNKKVRAALRPGTALSSAGMRAKAVMDLGVERAKDIVDAKLTQETTLTQETITVPGRLIGTTAGVGDPIVDGAPHTNGGGAG